MAYRVDDVPLWWRPFWWTACWAAALLAWLQFTLLRWTVRLGVEGAENVAGPGGRIYCFWHEGLWIWFTALAPHPRRLIPRQKQAWMQHPAAFMKPVHSTLRLLGIGIVLGSRGDEGRAAVDTIAVLLRDGGATAIAPDGPHGPVRELKKGVLHMAAASGAPIVPVRFEASRSFRQRGWDGKVTPVPFSRVTIRFGEPLAVSPEGLDEAAGRLTRALG